MKKPIALFLAFLLLLGMSGCKKEEPMTELAAIQKQLLDMEGYSATATLTRTSNKGETVYGTKQYYKSTGEYRLELTAPETTAGNYTVFDGSRICQYNPRLDHKLVKDVPTSQHRNELFLGAFMKNYVNSEGVGVAAAALDEAQCVILEAIIPGTDQALASEKLWVDRESLLPRRLVLYDKNGAERYRIDYEDFAFNPTFSPEIFTIDE